MTTSSGSYFLWADFFRGRGRQKAQSAVEALRGNILFSTLSDRELEYLATRVYRRVYEKDESVFHQDERGFGLYVIEQGNVAIKTKTPKGEVLVTTLGAGTFFGELALLEPDNIRSASAVPLERSVLIGFFKPDLLEILERKPGMGVKLLLQLSMVLGKRLLETTERIADVAG
ncbi:MAG: cyclic nucleotide-binding domain-containing protein [Oligoflexia bacterium]|nr:cyclic nucleotide-binding domain-containing protein [Oligoflexia bacterium]